MLLATEINLGTSGIAGSHSCGWPVLEPVRAGSYKIGDTYCSFDYSKSLFKAASDSPLRKIVGSNFEQHFVAWQNANAMQSHLAG